MRYLVVWGGTVVGDKKDDFVNWMKTEGFDVTYLEEFKTLPDVDTYGNRIPETGGRNDLIFSINADIGKFAIWRLQYGMSWWDDYVEGSCEKIEDDKDVKTYYIIPQHILDKYNTWGDITVKEVS